MGKTGRQKIDPRRVDGPARGGGVHTGKYSVLISKRYPKEFSEQLPTYQKHAVAIESRERRAYCFSMFQG